ncbi:MAG: hypothetical protein H0X66_14170 [Verrucomicrobia bacterium]|nr:hypothetical protein [Verrucomicrobiota bacterium]
MKRFAGLALMLLTLNLFAQEPGKKTPDSSITTDSIAKTNAPAPDLGALFRMHYVNRTAAFKEQNLALQNVVLLGDSITEGFNVTKHLPGRRILNRGIGADVIGIEMPEGDPRGVLRRLDNSVFDCAATDVFLLIGINDLGSGRSVEQMESGYREILKRIHEKAPSIRVHVQSVLPTAGKYARHNEPVLEFNKRIRKLAGEFGYSYIDLHKLMADEQGELKAEFTNDGLHLNDAAYAVWKTQVLQALNWH